MPLIVLLDKVPGFFIQLLQESGYETVEATQVNEQALSEALGKATGLLVRSKSRLDRKLLDRAPAVQFILRPGSGLENIDMEAVRERGIQLLNSSEGNRNAVAEHALGMLLSLLHYIPKAYQELKSGKWLREANRGTELAGSRVGIIGYGNTGSAFANKLKSLDVEILVYDKYMPPENAERPIRPVTLRELTDEADIISFHVPYNAETHYMLNARFLEQLKNPAYIINTSRGKVVDTNALMAGLANGKVKGVCLDVLEHEEPENYTAQEQEQMQKLLQRDDVIVTPHIAGWSQKSEVAIYRILLEKLDQTP